jgi:dienelactone hydrolase
VGNDVRQFYCGTEDRPIAAWFHPPASPSTSGFGVVVCNPFGNETLCAHRSLRHFAQSAADRGVPALRFDYLGTGDSADGARGESEVDAWIASIDVAIDTLKQTAGVSRIGLLGLRLGATLACLVAARRTDVAALVAIAPVVSGRSYLRELRALTFARPQKPVPAWASTGGNVEESGGFILPSDTRTRIAALDLLRLETKIADQVLLLDRDDLKVDPAWANHLEKCGAVVDRRRVDGFIGMMVEAQITVVPEATVRATTDWLVERAASAPPRSTPAPPSTRTSIVLTQENSVVPGAPVRETALRLDPGGLLFGIVSEPAAPAGPRAASPTAIVLLNSGAVHHVGPCGLYVSFARQWASQGDVVIRVDLSGIGESRTRPGEPENVVYSSRAQEDIAAVLEFIRARYGPVDCHAMGICSGGYHGFKAAVAGQPLRGVVAINPLTFFWKPGMSLMERDHAVVSETRRYASEFSLGSVGRLLKGDVNLVPVAQVFWRRGSSVLVNTLRDLARHLRIQLTDDLASELRRVAQQNTAMFFVFSEDDPGFHLLREQGGSLVHRLTRRGAIDVKIVEGADHTFTQHWARERLASLLTDVFHRTRRGHDAPPEGLRVNRPA